MKTLERVEQKAVKAGKKSLVTFKLGELFCGPGGLGIGAIASKVRTGDSVYEVQHAWANDYDADTCKTYARNICPGDPASVICCDVRELDIEKLSPIDAFAYGFPCNDFSIVGEQKGFKGRFGPLYTYGINIMDYFKPKFFVAENVGGIATANDGKAFKKILSDLENAGNGYKLTVHLYKSEEYGIPQTRHRVIIVGIEQSFNLRFQVPAPTTLRKYKTAKDALENPPIAKNAPNNEITAQSQIVVERLKYIRPGQNAWTADIPNELKLNVRGAKLSQIYKRLDPDKPSYTLTGSGGGGTHGYHWDEPRALTNRERARIQTFPDTFVFEGAKESVRKQIGMAVPPRLSEAIFSAVLKTFAGIEYDHVNPNISEECSLFENIK
jgi:DNA (cytosine-5)-methyltransferase 1